MKPALPLAKWRLAAPLFVATAAAALCALPPRAAHAQYEAWAARYDNPAHGSESLTRLALDGQGNIYAVGYTADGTMASPGSGALVVKYDRYGVRKWLRRIDGAESGGFDFGVSLAVTPDGASVVVGANIANAGATGVDIGVYKLSGATGATVWTRFISGTQTPTSGDSCAGVALDASGNAYVTGTVEDTPNATRAFLTARLGAANGAVAWSRRYTGNGAANSQNTAVALAVDSVRGAVFVTGISSGDDASSSSDYATLRYNLADGAGIWSSRYDSGSNKDETPRALVIDGAGDPVVTGRAINADGNGDALTIKYNGATGSEVWSARYNNPGAPDDNAEDYGVALATDAGGDVYLAAASQDNTRATFDMLTVRYRSASGNPVWERRYANGASSYDLPYGVAVAKGGDGCFVTGSIDGGASGMAPRLATLRYTSGGALAWVSARPKTRGAEFQSDSGEAVAVDPSTGAAYVAATAGGLPPATTTDALVVKYAPYAHGAAEASVGADGNTRVLWKKWDGGAVIRSYNSSGAVIAARVFAPPAGYRVRGLETGADNKTRLLWENNATGGVAVWTLSVNLATTETGFTYAASGYEIAAISVGSDAKPRLLWAKPNGVAAVWKLKNGVAGVESGTLFGPYANLAPFDIATGVTDQKTRLLWKNAATGAVTVWTLNVGGTAPEFGKVYTEPVGYGLGGMNVASDNRARLLWVRQSDRAAAVWRLNAAGTAIESGTVFGPIANVSPVALASGRTSGDARTRVLWQYEDGRAALWILNAADSAVSVGATLGQP